jgi:hypothetical protein
LGRNKAYSKGRHETCPYLWLLLAPSGIIEELLQLKVFPESPKNPFAVFLF